MLAPQQLDLEGFCRNLRRERTPERVFLFEHGIGPTLQEQVAQRFDLTAAIRHSRGTPPFAWEQEIQVYRFLGFELMRIWLPGAEFPVAGALGIAWGEEHEGPIQSWDDVARYPWPKPQDVDVARLEWYERNLPQDMAVFQGVKIWEVVRELFGFESFCLKLYEDPALVSEVTRRVGEFHLALVHMLCESRSILAVYAMDDYGHKTGTMMAPKTIRELFLPWHQKMAACAHEHGKFYFMHSCGKVDVLMDDLIHRVGIDAKHSFEDVIVPVTEAKRRWGHDVTLLGGLDVDILARSDEHTIRQRVREILDVCQPGGGYCFGSGNWVTEYIPLDNYLAALDEARHFGV